MRRRAVLGLLGCAPFYWPTFAAAQSADRLRRVGLLIPLSPEAEAARLWVAAVRNRLRELGAVEGRNFALDVRYSLDDDPERKVSRALLALYPDVVVVGGAPVVALMKETGTVPLVFVLYGDPIGAGLVTSLAHPGGNLTGFTHYDAPVCGKWPEILKEIAPQIDRVLALYVPAVFPSTWWSAMETAAASLGVRLSRAEIRDAASIEQAIARFAMEPNGGLISLPSGVTRVHQQLIIALATQHRLPALDPFTDFTHNGGLISYGVDREEQFRLAAGYADRILRGEKPGDLPIQQPTNFRLIVNLKAAKTLGLTVPQSLLARANEVIE